MNLLPKAIFNKLVKNVGKENVIPVVKYFGGSSFTWIFTEYDPETDLFFGLCDMGEPELGYCSREELFSLKFPPFGLPLERDRFFETDKNILDFYKEYKNG